MVDPSSFVIRQCRDGTCYLAYSAIVVHPYGIEEPYLKLLPFDSIRACRSFRDRLQEVVRKSTMIHDEMTLGRMPLRDDLREILVADWFDMVDKLCDDWVEEYIPLDIRNYYHYAQVMVFGDDEDWLRCFGNDYGKVPIA